MELNEDNLYTVFTSCLPGQDSEEKNYVAVQLMTAQNGFTQVDNPIYLDKKKVMKHKEEIDSFFGQLYSVHHSKVNIIDINEIYKKYDGSYWAKQPASILQLCYLGIVTGNCHPLYNNTKYQTVVLPLKRGIEKTTS
ncbi:MAG: hypothetical protein PUH10_08825 [Erysipelotrichaceae bacterium]|uniref:hypothetical protein n=1 Tax=Floccifex sp. TaxID=2815810 RepID=UPI002A75EE26|nr:hypothetical protein [Floccifex sp.]MDD7282071.1 hypothetical protein [Erysipelotrichaceae bacterium]MDY2958981.1 hypothetical protein [Floccifex sp.]